MNRRNCCSVISEMIKKVPANNIEFIKDLEWNFEDASYKAPEENLQWIRTQKTLIKHITLPKEEWEFEVLSIFTTQPIDLIKEQINNDN